MSTGTVNPIFGKLLVASEIEEAAIDTLIKWFPTYIKEVERQLGLQVGQIKPPVNYSNRNSFDSLSGEAMPKVVVISPGMIDEPQLFGKTYNAQWALGVGVAMSAQSEGLANAMVKMYGAAARGIMLHQFRKTRMSQAVRLISETYDDLPVESQFQHYRAAGVYFSVDVNDVVTKNIGPDTPDEDPYAYGQVEEVFIDLIKQESE